MGPYLAILLDCPLFAGFSREDLTRMLDCLGSQVRDYGKGDYLFLEGDPAAYVGVVLSGAVQIVRDDVDGSRSVLSVAQPGELFGEVFACAALAAVPVSAAAVQDSRVLLLDCRRALTTCTGTCLFHSRLVANLLRVLAEKNLELSRKIDFMSRRTTREKLLAYLLDQAKRQNSTVFTIPYDRQGLADFLGVERSALSAEIGKLRRTGVIDSRGSWFALGDMSACQGHGNTL